MDQTLISSRVRELLAEVLDVPAASIGPGFSAESAPTWTSLNHLMLISQIENEFRVFFSNQEIRDLTSYDQIVESIARHLKAGT
jgi:acyl carrier protein